jgi:hypothetical protein
MGTEKENSGACAPNDNDKVVWSDGHWPFYHTPSFQSIH